MVNKRDINIDLVRVLSCMGVFGFHSFQENLESVNIFIYRLYGFAIPMFFCHKWIFFDIKRGKHKEKRFQDN